MGRKRKKRSDMREREGVEWEESGRGSEGGRVRGRDGERENKKPNKNVGTLINLTW